MNLGTTFRGPRHAQRSARSLGVSANGESGDGRRARKWVATVSVVAVLMMGAAPALAESTVGEPAATQTEDQSVVDPAGSGSDAGAGTDSADAGKGGSEDSGTTGADTKSDDSSDSGSTGTDATGTGATGTDATDPGKTDPETPAADTTPGSDAEKTDAEAGEGADGTGSQAMASRGAGVQGDDAGGPVVFLVPSPDLNGAVINVNLKTLRTGGTAATAGIKFQLFSSASGGSGGNSYEMPGTAINDTWATCTTDADGDCSIKVPSSARNQQYWVVAVSNTGTGSLFNDYFVTGDNTESGTDRFAVTPYAFRAPTLAANQTYQLPGSASMPTRSRVGNPMLPLSLTVPTANRWSNLGSDMVASLNNPRYVPVCNAPPKVAIIVDLSTSMTTNNNEGLIGARTAAKDFAAAFVDKNVTLGVYSFGSNANTATVSPTVVTSANIGSIQTSISNMSVSGIQYTNWDKGLEQVQGMGFNMVVVLTDGNPTRYGSPAAPSSGSWTNLRGLEESVLSANLLKSQGSQIVTFGVGAYLNSSMPQNLKAVTGPIQWVAGSTGPSSNIATSDFAITSSWTTVATQLASLAGSITCEATVQVKKQVRGLDDQLTNGQGWKFTPTATLPTDATISPSTQQTTNSSGLLPSPFTIKFANGADTASLQIAEDTSSIDYTFESVACVNNGTTQVAVANAATFTLTGLKKGDNVVCTVINKRVPTNVVVSKTWLVQNAQGQTLITVHDPAQGGDGTLPSGIGAQLLLSTPGTTNMTNQAWGVARTGYTAGGSNTVRIDETALAGSPSIVNLAGCTLTSARVTLQKLGSGAATNPNADILGAAYFTSGTLAVGTNSFEITNTVRCDTKLTLVKTLDTPYDPTLASGWMLTATGATTITGTATNGNITNRSVTPGSYTLSEEMRAGFELKTDWVCTNRGAALATAGGGAQAVTVDIPLGGDVTCVIVNRELPRTATMKVDKVWRITDGRGGVIYDSSTSTGTLPAGISAALAVAGPAPATTPTPRNWGQVVTGLADGDVMTISETTSIIGLPGCWLVSATFTKANEVAQNTPMGSGVQVTLVSGANSYEVTNVVTCETKLVLLKTVEGGGSGESGDWSLTATGTTNPSDTATVLGAETKSAANTVLVSANEQYGLSEAFTTAGANLAYLFDRLELCTPQEDGSCVWTTVNEGAAVQVPLGQERIYRFVNVLAPSIQVPLTGGAASDMFAGLGLSVLALAALLGGVAWARTRRQAVRS